MWFQILNATEDDLETLEEPSGEDRDDHVGVFKAGHTEAVALADGKAGDVAGEGQAASASEGVSETCPGVSEDRRSSINLIDF